MAKSYNGHHCWNCWNVSLWISNDEPLYRAALECRRQYPKSANRAALSFINNVVGEGSRTPDGAVYSVNAVRSALSGLA